ncbi:MAG: hypothetical protein CVU52_09195 [Deltaproteobacteria bacterium HGW-Deltaproteobacteria-10]|nr:MAG: hypothetical protein CVU52_09195 [Deltaproteobacteria bacterium HGW-Deltaproteobacteria-10]
MKREEKITEDYLIASGFKDIVFEPNGNIPPDFSIEGKIGVEVRRLNQNYFTEDKASGLEEDRIPLFKLFETTLKKFDAQYSGKTYWISIRFSRPIPNSKITQNAINHSLSDFLNNPYQLPCWIQATKTISLHVSESQPVTGRVFRFAAGVDRESGGFVLKEFINNFNYCMQVKSEIISKHYNKYNSWWLVLVDSIAYGFTEAEKKEIKSMVSVNSLWDKVIVLDSLKGNNILEF